MKKIFLFTVASIATIAMSAQRFDFGANFMTGLPLGNYNFGDADLELSVPPGFGIGGGIEANYWFNDALSAGLEVGFLRFSEKEKSFSAIGVALSSKATIIPIIVKADYHFLDDAFRPFVGIGVGYAIVSREWISSNDFSKVRWDQNGLLISPRAGALYQFTNALAAKLSVQYNLMFNAVDGDLELTKSIMGNTQTQNVANTKAGATNYLGINLGVVYTLFD